jgi:hypothetical protein
MASNGLQHTIKLITYMGSAINKQNTDYSEEGHNRTSIGVR